MRYPESVNQNRSNRVEIIKVTSFPIHSTQLTLNEQKSYVSSTQDTASRRIWQSEPSPIRGSSV